MPTMIVTRGLPASGKTTWANNFIKENKGYINLNRDDFRKMIYGDNYKYSKQKEKFVTDLQMTSLLEAIKQNKNVIISDTNLNDKVFDTFKNLAKEHKYHFEIHDTFWVFCLNYNKINKSPKSIIIEDIFNIKDIENWNNCGKFFMFNDYLDLCLKNNKNRGVGYVPESVIKGMAEKYYYSNFKLNNIIDNADNDKAVIFDIDGTLAHKCDRDIYDGSKAIDDYLDQNVYKLLCMEKNYLGNKIIIMSGRDEKYREVTENWLLKNNINYDELFMRPENDTRPDDLVKFELYCLNVKHNFVVERVYDDRDKVVRMWRKLLGLKTFQVEYGDF